jgi:hypothetical protein
MKRSIKLILSWIQEPIGIFHELTEICQTLTTLKKLWKTTNPPGLFYQTDRTLNPNSKQASALDSTQSCRR